MFRVLENIIKIFNFTERLVNYQHLFTKGVIGNVFFSNISKMALFFT
jgi:hypothetical protein